MPVRRPLVLATLTLSLAGCCMLGKHRDSAEFRQRASASCYDMRPAELIRHMARAAQTTAAYAQGVTIDVERATFERADGLRGRVSWTGSCSVPSFEAVDDTEPLYVYLRHDLGAYADHPSRPLPGQ
jgi:hypothetical protein